MDRTRSICSMVFISFSSCKAFRWILSQLSEPSHVPSRSTRRSTQTLSSPQNSRPRPKTAMEGSVGHAALRPGALADGRMVLWFKHTGLPSRPLHPPGVLSAPGDLICTCSKGTSGRSVPARGGSRQVQSRPDTAEAEELPGSECFGRARLRAHLGGGHIYSLKRLNKALIAHHRTHPEQS